MKKYLILFLSLLIVSGCKNNKIFTLNGSVNGPTYKYLYINQVNIDTPVLIDSAKINSKGNFRVRIKTTEPDFYQVGFSKTNYITLLAGPGEKIKLTFNDTSLYKNYYITGSRGSELVQKLDVKLQETRNRLDSLNKAYDIASKEPGFDKKGPLLEQKYLNVIKEQRKFNINFIIGNLTSLASVKALYQKINDQMYVLYDTRDLQYLKIVSDSLRKYYPESRHTKALVSDFEKELNQFYARKLEQMAATMPQRKLDPDLKDINGRRITLSALKGKYVLLAFWSANSKDCITENLQLKEFYRLYNRKGFEIYQINLDEDETVWKAAVKFDELPWISTREVNSAGMTNARLYNVTTVPTNYLYDRAGNIIATNLHGRNLQIKLEQLFNN